MELVELLPLDISAEEEWGERFSTTITLTVTFETTINLHQHLRGWKNQANQTKSV